MHNNLSCSSVFIDSFTGDVKIGDFALAGAQNKKLFEVGSPESLSPEILAEKSVTGSDIWSFGMMLIEMSTGLVPYSDCANMIEVSRRVMERSWPSEIELIKDEDVKQLILSCLAWNKEDRPSADDLLLNPFFSESDEDRSLSPVRLVDRKQRSNERSA